MPGAIILSAALALAAHDHEPGLQQLQKRLSSDGYSISEYIGDPRFEIYEPRNGRAIDYSDTTEFWYLKNDSIEKCADFAHWQGMWLEKAEKEYGVPPEYIVSELRLETRLGHYLGEHPAINSLISKYLHRQGSSREFYYGEIKALLRDYKYFASDIFELPGSSSGAIGIMQFTPYFRRFDGDGRFDPFTMPDAIGSAANYLSRNGFRGDPRKAVYRYNPNDPYYAKAVTAHAEILKEKMKRREAEFMKSLKPLNRIMPKGVQMRMPQKSSIKSRH